ncbi:MAG TPA: hypothetical protein VH085_08170 [Nocardioides sp.]|nr:hypothetical protein [Nocardioides sp.]
MTVLVLTGGCSSSSDSSERPPRPVVIPGQASARPGHDQGHGEAHDSAPALQRLPDSWRSVPWATHRAGRAPSRRAVIPGVLDGHGAPARLAHQVPGSPHGHGWATERVLFLGRDGRWRALDLADLGLPERWWPGPDSSQAGALSTDGRTWAAPTLSGVVLVDLITGEHHHVAFPRTSPEVRHVAWVPGTHVVSAYASSPEGRRFTTFRLGRRGAPQQASYDGSRSTFDVDGAPVAIVSGGRSLSLSRSVEVGPIALQWSLPFRFARGTPFGVFSDEDVALLQPTHDDRRPRTVWVFDKVSGEALERLRVPIHSAIDGWTEHGALIMTISHRHVVTWDPATGAFHRWLELAPPDPAPGDRADDAIALPAR